MRSSPPNLLFLSPGKSASTWNLHKTNVVRTAFILHVSLDYAFIVACLGRVRALRFSARTREMGNLLSYKLAHERIGGRKRGRGLPIESWPGHNHCVWDVASAGVS